MAFESRRLRVQLWCGDETLVCDDQVSLIAEQTPAVPVLRCGFSCDQYQSYPRPAPGPVYCNWSLTAPCGFSGDPTVYVNQILVDAAQLPMLRAQLEAQLKEVEAAERAVKKFRERETKD